VMLGSVGILVLYLVGGIAAGIGFLLLGNPSLAPMVGASGSVSALIAFYALAEPKKRVSFFYFFSPFEGYYGWLYLPTLLILPLSFAGDLASYIASSVIPTGAASTAHIGGAMFGCTAGLAWRLITSKSWRTA
jgi:membrane associated rhomboid family serine protease